jgi:hypothetical protein
VWICSFRMMVVKQISCAPSVATSLLLLTKTSLSLLFGFLSSTFFPSHYTSHYH